MNNQTHDYTPAFAPVIIIAAVAFGVWSWITHWGGVSLTMLGEPATLSSGFLGLTAVVLGSCVLLRAPLRSLLATTGLFAGFGFLWVIAQVVPGAVS
jgi:hypothetical protein